MLAVQLHLVVGAFGLLFAVAAVVVTVIDVWFKHHRR